MFLESTQPLTEMSTRSISWGWRQPMGKADNLPPSCAVVTKSGNLNFLELSGPVQACNGTALPFTVDSLYTICPPRAMNFLSKKILSDLFSPHNKNCTEHVVNYILQFVFLRSSYAKSHFPVQYLCPSFRVRNDGAQLKVCLWETSRDLKTDFKEKGYIKIVPVLRQVCEHNWGHTPQIWFLSWRPNALT